MRGFQPYLYSILRFPILGFFLYHLVQANIGIVTFQYTFVLDYLMVIRASSFFICRQFLHCGFYTWQSGVTTLLLVLLTTRFMIKRLTEIIDSLSAIQAACNLENRMASSIFRHDDHLPSHRQYPGWEF